MNYIQAVAPNLSAVGYPDYCLAYVEQVFGVQNDPDPDAWQGWLNTKHKHTDPVPTNVSVPVWFSWTGTIDGITQNWGHVAVSTPNGVYTNPLSGSGHKVYPSVAALATAYGVGYVGWSEDIGNLMIIKENDMPTPKQIDLAVKIAFNRPATQDEIDRFTPASWDDVLLTLLTNNESERAKADQFDSVKAALDAANAKLADPVPADPNSVTVTKDGLWASFKKFLGL